MTIRQRAFTVFMNSSDGVASRYNRKIVSIIFKCVRELLKRKDHPVITVDSIYPYAENILKENHLALLKNDLNDIIIEIINFLIENGETDIYDNLLDEIDAELKKALWPDVSKVNNPEILNILIDEIFNELDSKNEYSTENLADRLAENGMFEKFSYNELLEISETALSKLEEMNFISE